MNQRKRKRQFWMTATHSVATLKKAFFSSIERQQKTVQSPALDAKAGALPCINSCCYPIGTLDKVATPANTQSKQIQQLIQHPLHPLHPLQRNKSMGFKASIAEFLLVIRLRFQSKRQHLLPKQPVSQRCQNILERALQMVLITCKHWFLDKDSQSMADNRRTIGSSSNSSKPSVKVSFKSTMGKDPTD